MLRQVIQDTYEKEFGHKNGQEGKNVMQFDISLNLDHDKEDGYRWIEVRLGGSQYYPICSSFNSIGTGWVLQIDTQTMLLQFIGFSLGTYNIDLTQNSNARDQNGQFYVNSNITMLMESAFSIPLNTWVHVALTSFRLANQKSAKLMYLNGVPDRSIGWYCPNGVWSSQGQVIANNPYLQCGTLKIGSSLEYNLNQTYNVPETWRSL